MSFVEQFQFTLDMRNRVDRINFGSLLKQQGFNDSYEIIDVMVIEVCVSQFHDFLKLVDDKPSRSDLANGVILTLRDTEDQYLLQFVFVKGKNDLYLPAMLNAPKFDGCILAMSFNIAVRQKELKPVIIYRPS
jgi:hypothetical protein